jgi:hypothetical protein
VRSEENGLKTHSSHNNSRTENTHPSEFIRDLLLKQGITEDNQVVFEDNLLTNFQDLQ